MSEPHVEIPGPDGQTVRLEDAHTLIGATYDLLDHDLAALLDAFAEVIDVRAGNIDEHASDADFCLHYLHRACARDLRRLSDHVGTTLNHIEKL